MCIFTAKLPVRLNRQYNIKRINIKSDSTHLVHISVRCGWVDSDTDRVQSPQIGTTRRLDIVQYNWNLHQNVSF